MAQEVAKTASGVPAYLKPKQHKVGNVDASDLIIPRLKLLHGISPELEAFEKAKQGTYWHTVAEQSLGTELVIVPIKIRKEFSLWAPRGDPRGRLARSMDCINWDVRDEFTVKPKNAKDQVWSTKEGTVKGSGLSDWGSSIKEDRDSQPAAALTYNMLVYLPEYPELSPVMLINTRSSVRPMQGLISKIEMRPVDHFYQQYKMGVVKATNDDNQAFFNYSYTADGYVPEELSKVTAALYDRYKDVMVEASDDRDEAEEAGPKSTKPEGKVGGKKGNF